MIDKKILKIFIIGLLISATAITISIISNLSSEFNDIKLFILPFGETGGQQALFFYLLVLLIPYLAILLGYGLAYIVVRIYCRLTKFSKRIEFVGYAKTDRSGKYLGRRYLIQLIFASLLCMNIWVYIMTNDKLLEFWISTEGKLLMYGDNGSILNFVMIPWYWIPLFITIIPFTLCSVIVDSGLVSVKKLRGQSEFSDTERVGDKLFGFIKGYAGISVIFSFILLLQTDKGGELSIVFYPLTAIVQLIHLIIAIDLFKDVGRKLIFKAVKPYYTPQLIELSFNKKDLTDINDLLNQTNK